MAEGKYIVFKQEEFFELMGELGLPPYFPRPDVVGDQGEAAGTDWECDRIATHIQNRVEAVAIKDAVVIRRQDVFAPIAFSSYADGVKTALSLAEKGPVSEHLDETAIYFYEQARLSWATNRKLPT